MCQDALIPGKEDDIWLHRMDWPRLSSRLWPVMCCHQCGDQGQCCPVWGGNMNGHTQDHPQHTPTEIWTQAHREMAASWDSDRERGEDEPRGTMGA